MGNKQSNFETVLRKQACTCEVRFCYMFILCHGHLLFYGLILWLNIFDIGGVFHF